MAAENKKYPELAWQIPIDCHFIGGFVLDNEVEQMCNRLHGVMPEFVCFSIYSCRRILTTKRKWRLLPYASVVIRIWGARINCSCERQSNDRAEKGESEERKQHTTAARPQRERGPGQWRWMQWRRLLQLI